jgi:hypothetical protein
MPISITIDANVLSELRRKQSLLDWLEVEWPSCFMGGMTCQE